MKIPLLLAMLASVSCLSSNALAACEPGAYGTGDGNFVVVVNVPNMPPPGQRYLFRDGRRGSTADDDSPVRCEGAAVVVRAAGDKTAIWQPLPITATDTKFESALTMMKGQLLEPADRPDHKRPLVVMVHGSERTSAVGNPYAYALAAQGLAVFVYDKRGTGGSNGEYTQNFELLADDAAAALAHARAMAAGRFSHAGYFGGSQGGWVAPLAATRSDADFVAIGFGLVASPIDEDRDQMLAEAREAGLGEEQLDQIRRLSQATARIVTSHFREGFAELQALRTELKDETWPSRIKGEYSGAFLAMSDADLRRIGRPRFDNLELIYDYDAIAVLEKLDVPLLWVLAGEDREAPIAETRDALLALKSRGKPVDVYLFPDTDHGMFEFETLPDGSRKGTRITDGYLRLLGDWMKNKARGRYGRGERLK